MIGYLFHGSHTKIGGVLNPHISFHGIPLLYASSDILYALVRCGKFDGNILIREDYTNGNYHLCELVPGAFEKVFDCDGYIYIFKPNGFKLLLDIGLSGMDNEYASTTSQQYVDVVYIKNILDEIKNHTSYYDLVYYEDAKDEYWSHITGGKNGYISRRKKTIGGNKMTDVRCYKCIYSECVNPKDLIYRCKNPKIHKYQVYGEDHCNKGKSKMIERGQRAKTKIYDDPIPCPNCGSLLTYTDGIRKCTSCEYQLTVSEIDYSHNHSRICMVCGGTLNQNELQICEQCKIKIKNNLEGLK